MNILVPVSTSPTNDATIEAAIDRIGDEGGTIHLVYSETPGHEQGRHQRVNELLEHSANLVRDGTGGEITVFTDHLARDRYLPSPHDHAAEFATYAEKHGIDLVLIDRNYSVDATDAKLQPLHHALDQVDLPYEYADVRRSHITSPLETNRFIAVFTFTFAFYLVVTASLEPFDLLIGLISAGFAGVLFRNVTFETTPKVVQALGVFGRGIVFVPYLLGKILIANIQISYLILHPSLPIDPHLDRVETELSGGLAVTALANSLTLTPGTLSVDADRSSLLVHSITEDTRREVLTGERRQAIEFVYYGRAGVTPVDRILVDQVETVGGPIDARDLADGEVEP